MGAPFEKVAAEDRQYCAWVLREERESDQLSRNLKAFARYLRQQHGGLMTVGKHAGKFLDELLRDDADYVYWVTTLSRPSCAMKEFSKYIVEQQHVENYQDSRKRTRNEAHDGKCILCLDSALTAAFIPCGHCVCCYECASKMKSNRCPMCRKPSKVQRLYVG